ncbi:MAG TPA: HAMP domain-containing sensor histidine kinase [Calditerricola sp.]
MAIKWRLTLFSTLGLVALLLLFNVFVYRVLWEYFQYAERERLSDKAHDLVELYREVRPSLTDQTAWLRSHVGEQEAVRILKKGAVVVEADPHGLFRAASPAGNEASAPILTVTLPLTRDGDEVLLLASVMDEARRHMDRVIKTTVLGSAFVLIGAVGGGYGMTRFAFRPVTSMIRTVRSISPSVPEPRVPVPNSRDELAELAATFNDLLGRINALLSRQRQFVADASHELKTPLTVIEGYLRLLRRWGAADPAVRDEALAAIEHHVTRMKRLTHDLLFLARLETEPEAEGPKALVNMTLLADRVFRDVHALHPRRKMARTGDSGPLYTLGWEDQLEQLLYILLDNAVQHTAVDAGITVHTIAKEEWVVCEVHDEGPGIPAEDQPYVFERFYRVDKARARRRGGSGLGLAIAKAIVQAHGGRIEVESALGQGTTFRVLLPRYRGE